MTLLTIIQETTDRIGIARPSVVMTSTDQIVRQLLGLVIEECNSLVKRANWQGLTTEQTFLTVAGEVQTNTPIPADVKRFLPDTFFNRTTRRQLIGPITPQEYQAIKAQPALNRVYLSFRERDGQFMITPEPPAGETIAYEYVSSYWAKSSANVPKATFTSDDDTTYLDEELVKLGLRWRWKAAKGLSYAEDMETYERAVQEAAGADGGYGQLNLGGYDRSYPYWRANIPEGNFGL